MNIEIRDAISDDIAIIAANNSRMAEETENRSLEPEIVNPGVASLLRDPNKGRYWVATCGGKLVGQIMVTFEWSDWRNGTLWWIQSVFVHEDFRRQGVFSALYRHVESLAKKTEDVCGLRLYVESKNENAQKAYEALGMSKPGYLVMQSILSQTQN